jgi:hypothetical protein
MNWLDFWASIIGSIASLGWPASVFGGLYLFRSALRDAIPKLRLKHGETEISVQLDQAEQQASRLPAPVQPPDTSSIEEADIYAKLASISPRAAVLEARTSVDHAIRQKARDAGLEFADKLTSSALVRELSKRSLLDKGTIKLIDDLRVIGNAAAHDPYIDLKSDGAIRFGKLARQVAENMGRLF